MTPQFPGFPPEALKFLKALKKNNDREWFQPRKEKFDRYLREPMLKLLEGINRHMAGFAPDYVTDPAKAIFRIYRDTRFSNNKTPYKTHLAAVFSHRLLPRNQGAGFYFQVSPEKVGIGGGIYHPPPDLLRVIRAHFAIEHETLQKEIRMITTKKSAGHFEGEPLTRAPKGFEPDHPAADLLKCRSFFFYEDLPSETMLDAGLQSAIVSRFKAIRKLVELVDKPIVGRKKFSLGEEF